MKMLLLAFVFFFIVMTIREALIILENHPIFSGSLILFFIICAFNTFDGGVIVKFFKILGIILITGFVLCVIQALCNIVKEETETRNEKKD